MYRKNLLALLSMFFLVSVILLLYGCGEEDKADKILGENSSGVYTGFMNMKGGEWAEYTITNGKERNEFIGTDTYNGRKCSIIEFEMLLSEKRTISQVWIDIEKGESVLYVQKIGDKVYKLDFQSLPQDIPTTGGNDTPNKYSVAKQTRTDTYTTPTGKKVNVAVFTSTNGEDWVSSEVPFGIVKFIDQNGVTRMELYDFGISGAERDISKEEALNAKSIFDFEFDE